MGTLSPRGEGKVSISNHHSYIKRESKLFIIMFKCNLPLAPWGEGARRAGEGLF